jgi:hypothetical protein
MRGWIAMAAACASGVAASAGERWESLPAWVDASRVPLVGRLNTSFVTLANLNHLLVDVPEWPSTGVEYYQEGWVSPAAIEAVEAGLSR